MKEKRWELNFDKPPTTVEWIFLILFALKVAGVISVSWFIVVIPIMIEAIIALFALGFMFKERR